ncbi:unnamed protein product [Fraxinus pennsylvanica]|uniref:Uncharacterized protein n=1 Tax=Fraxinus pennsylvanica TaxID=56036 RepID=A0AAD1ZXA4_9LAMI|nr:unnamed protein product [Fraxinus pennsylvanica]
MSKKVHSQGNVPFSWENKPGVRKITLQEYDVHHHQYFAPPKLPPPPCPPENGRASFHDMQIPLPPCTFQQLSRSDSRKGLKKIDDPFLIAYKECTKSTRKGKTTSCAGREDNKGFGLTKKNVPVSVFSCKKSCSVREDSIIKLS